MLFKKNLLTVLLLGTSSLSFALGSPCEGYASKLFGNNVCIFDEAQSKGDIQSIVDNLHRQEKNDEFGSNGYALLFHTGNYSKVSVPVGFYTQVAGLGLSPDETELKTVKVDGDDLIGNTSLTNFWRSAENLRVSEHLVWAVSQAAPLRNVHVPGVLVLALGGDHWASGGFLANCHIDKGIASSGQQQWLTRNTNMGAWYDPGVWNMVFVGSQQTPDKADYPNTIVAKTPRIQEKPYLIFDKASNEFQVMVPELKTNSSGHDWEAMGSRIPQSQFVIVNPSMSSEAISKALKAKQGPKALIFTPGLYSFDSTVTLDEDNTVVLGLGVPVLMATKPHISILTTHASGVKISGIILEAGAKDPIQDTDPALLEVGEPHQDLGNVNSPTLLSDLYCRVGGRVMEGKTNTCVTINDSHVIGDNLWLWRADHDRDGWTSWEKNLSNHGLIVNGHDVSIYGLAVEHFEENQVLWAGENGSVYMYQSELPYDVPSKSHDFKVHASFKIMDNVKHFNGYGFGIYDFFRSGGPGAYSESAIETPDHAGISFTHMVSVKLGESKGDKHIISMIKTTGEGGHLIGPSSAAGISPFAFWKGALDK